VVGAQWRALQCRGVEIGPQQFREIKLGIGQLPQQEIADALFTTGANEQIGIPAASAMRAARWRGQMSASL
jgi:hypothetical protein